MDPNIYINQQVQSGKDIVFAETHADLSSTFNFMRDSIVANPAKVNVAALELPRTFQPLIDNVDQMGREDFIEQSVIALSISDLQTAYEMRMNNQITEEEYLLVTDEQAYMIDAIQAEGLAGVYTPEGIQDMTERYGALHDLAVAGKENNVPIVATDLNREMAVAMSVAQLTCNYEHPLLSTDTIEDRMNDEPYYDALGQKVDLSASGSNLIHRGANHIWGLNGTENGVDDLLEADGREVTVVGIHNSPNEINYARISMDRSGYTLDDPSDVTVMDGALHDRPDLEIGKAHESETPYDEFIQGATSCAPASP